ncbi:MAG TPA: hypothetical protein VEZ42_19165 [Pseudonocardia sp.]|nr:hypothetical protein [Pseudonocardia sp.]
MSTAEPSVSGVEVVVPAARPPRPLVGRFLAVMLVAAVGFGFVATQSTPEVSGSAGPSAVVSDVTPSGERLVAHVGFWGCAGAIFSAVASTAIPIGKVVKLRKAAQFYGGVRNLARRLTDAGGRAAKVRVLSAAGVAGAAEILSIKGIADNC